MPFTPTNKNCESCLMPFSKDPGVRESEKYCSFCFRNGELRYLGNNLKEFKTICYEGMLKRGINPFMATFYTYMIGFAPRWKKT